MAKKLLSVLLTLCLAVSILAVGIPSASALDNGGLAEKAGTVYISDIFVSTAADSADARKTIEDSGYTFIDHNTMAGSSSGAYVGYKTSSNPADAITGLVFSEKMEKQISYKGRTYTTQTSTFMGMTGYIPFRYESGDETSLHLYYTKEKSESETTEYLTALDVAEGSSYSLRGRDYQSVVCAETNQPQNLNSVSKKRQPTFLVYQAQMSPDETYQKEGSGDLSAEVKSVNGINYYNFNASVDKADFLKRAVTGEYNGSSAVKSWSQVLYAMLSAKNEGVGYRNRLGSFDTAYGQGKYLDMVAALSNGDGKNNADMGRGLILQSTGVQTAGSLTAVKSKMLELLNSFDIENWWTKGDVDINGNLVKQDLFENVSSSSDVVYSLCMAVDDSTMHGHDKSATVMGLAFYNFRLVPLVQNGNDKNEDLLNFAEVYTQQGEAKNTVKIDKNNTNTSVSASSSYANTTQSQTTNSHAETNGQTYTATQGITLSGQVPFIKVNASVNISLSEAFNFSATDTVTEAITTSETDTSGLTYTIPAHSIALLNGSFSEETRTQQYDCPVALVYDVAFVSSGAELGATDGAHDDVAYKTDYYATFGNETASAVDVLKNLNSSNGSKTDGFTVKTIQDGAFSSYTSSEWSHIFNKYVESSEYPSAMSSTVRFITNYQPASFLGGVFTSDVSAKKYNFDKFYSLYPIDKIKVFKTKPASTVQELVEHIDLDKGEKEYFLRDYISAVSAYNQFNTEWTGWDSTQGYWALVSLDDNGKEVVRKITEVPVSDGNIRACKDPVSSVISIIPIANGKSYVRFVINENTFEYYDDNTSDTSSDFNSANIKYVTNNDISAKGTIQINTSNVTSHSYDENGFCTVCGQFQPAFLNKDGVYEISNTGQLCWFSALVNGDKAYADFDEQKTGASAVLLNDIDMSKRSEMIGTNGSRYTGAFDGADHTVKLNYNVAHASGDNPAALFAFTSGASIRNLNTTGAITTGNKYAGGIVGINHDTGVHISKCASSVDIHSNVDGDGTHGGILGVSNVSSADLIENCLFSGSITGENTTACAGIAGWFNNNQSKVKNCYSTASYRIKDDGCNQIARGKGAVENCYYLNSLSGTDGIQKTAEQFKSGEVAYLLNNGVTDGTQAWYQNIDNGKTPDDSPAFSGGTVYKNSGEVYSNTDKTADAFERDDDNNLLIKSYEDLEKLAQLMRSDYDVYGSESYALKNNIFAEGNSVWSIGIGSADENKPFNGAFHGNGYIIAGLNINTGSYGGLFEVIGENGTVDNLLVIDCDYTTSSCQNAGGIAAVNNGTISYCVSGVNITSGRLFYNPKTQESIAAAELNSNIRGKTAGGVAAINNGKICASRNASIVVATENAGGIAGMNKGEIYACANNAGIGSTGAKVSGGLAGTNTGRIESSYNSGKIQGKTSGNAGAVAGINGVTGENIPVVTNVFYYVINGVNGVGKGSAAQLDSSNMKKANASSMQKDDFTSELNAVTKDVKWVRSDAKNQSFPTIESELLKTAVRKSASGITVKGVMHEDLQIEYALCGESSESYKVLSSYAGGKKFSVYGAKITDRDGVPIPFELWGQGPLEISIPAGNDVQIIGLTSENKPFEIASKTNNGMTVFTVDEPVEFVMVSDKTQQGISENPTGGSSEGSTITNDKGAVNTGELSMLLIPMIIILFAAAFLLLFMQRGKRSE